MEELKLNNEYQLKLKGMNHEDKLKETTEKFAQELELAKSIQCTYNIQCNSLFDAMTLMRSCLKDYCQTVHNPEYLAIESLNMNDELTQK